MWLPPVAKQMAAIMLHSAHDQLDQNNHQLLD